MEPSLERAAERQDPVGRSYQRHAKELDAGVGKAKEEHASASAKQAGCVL